MKILESEVTLTTTKPNLLPPTTKNKPNMPNTITTKTDLKYLILLLL